MNRAILLFSFILFSAFLYGQQCTSGNCDNGYGTFVWTNGDKYILVTGPIKKCMARGLIIFQIRIDTQEHGKKVN